MQITAVYATLHGLTLDPIGLFATVVASVEHIGVASAKQKEFDITAREKLCMQQAVQINDLNFPVRGGGTGT